MDQGLVEVRLVRFPLRLWQPSQEHVDELLREFALIAQGEQQDLHSVPRRLGDLVGELSATYGAMSVGTEAERDDAIARGARETTLVYQVPPEVSAAIERLGEMLDAADAYCRGGTALLTLATPPEQVRFRRWFLSEFLAQIAGEPAVAWPDYAPVPDPTQRGAHRA